MLPALLKFVTLDETEPTRRRVLRSTLSDEECRVVDAFIAARLLTSDAEGEDAVIEVAHEALFRQWPPLRQAIEARAGDLRQRAELERWALDWAHSGHRDSFLLRGERLEIAQQWAAGHGELAIELPLLHEFLDRSRRSDRAAMERLSETVARDALATVDDDPERSLLLALAAIQECAPTPPARRALLTALAASRARTPLCGHQDMVWDVSWSPDGRRLATASGDRTARIWDTDGGNELAILEGHQDWVRSVTWSPDSQCLATASNDRTVRIWDAAHGTELAALYGHQGWVWGVAWSPDGQRLASASADLTVRVWDVNNANELAVLCGHENIVRGVAWSPDGKRIATVSRDSTVRIWQVDSAKELAVLHGHQDVVRTVAWSPDGCRLATSSNDRTPPMWAKAS